MIRPCTLTFLKYTLYLSHLPRAQSGTDQICPQTCGHHQRGTSTAEPLTDATRATLDTVLSELELIK